MHQFAGGPQQPEGRALDGRHERRFDSEEADLTALLPVQRGGPLLLGDVGQRGQVRCHLVEQGSGEASPKLIHKGSLCPDILINEMTQLGNSELMKVLGLGCA